MYNATTMLSQMRSNPIYGRLKDNRKLYYLDYLNSEHWKNLRRSKLEMSPKCEKCNSVFSLEVHHLKYKNLYDVDLEDLQTLCKICHQKVHKDKLFAVTKLDYRIIYYCLIRILQICNKFIDREKRKSYSCRKLSSFQIRKQKKFDKNFLIPKKSINSYISIHY